MLLVDRAVGSNHLVGPLRDSYGIDAHLADLDFGGDVAFNGRGEADTTLFVGVELKNLSDLLQSMSSKRLAGHQLLKMTQAYDRRYLIVEGDYQVNKDGRMCQWKRRVGQKTLKPMPGAPKALAFEKELLTLQHRGGLYVRHTTGRTGTYLYLAALYRFWTDRAMDEHKSHLAIYAPDLDRALMLPISLKRKVAAQLPGIGYEMSQRVDNHFPSIRAMINAKEDEWKQIPGIGSKTAKTLVKVCSKLY